MNRACALLLTAFALTQAACSGLSVREQAQVDALVADARSMQIVCDQADACARPSPLRDLGLRAAGASIAVNPAPSSDSSPEDPPPEDPPRRDAAFVAEPAPRTVPQAVSSANASADASASAAAVPQHYALILDYGQDALLARLDLIRSATRSIDLQTYIFDEDDAGHLILDELFAAARRGVKVRVLVDQLSALKRVDTLAALAGAHVNFEMRVYNPVLGRARISYPMYAFASACCWRRLNQRMHNKLLLVDGLVAITGGRNYQNDYYDWDTRYNFRDRDVLVAGPAVGEMSGNFEAFWHAPRSTPLTRLSDVGRQVLRSGVPALAHPEPEQPRRIDAISRDADDPGLVRSRLVDAAIAVREIRFIADPPEKHRRLADDTARSSLGLRDLIGSAQHRVLLQTPYLVLSDPAQRLFRELQQRDRPPRVIVSTNSLAATDAFIPYALSYKYKRRYLRDFKFEIYEFKPFPQDAPIDLEATGTVEIEWRADGTAVVRDGASGTEADKAQRSATTVVLRGSEGSGSGTAGSGMLGSGEVGLVGSPSSGRPKPLLPLAREYAALRYSKRGANEPLPLKRGGVRFGLHAKSLVIDDRIGVIGTHNFACRPKRTPPRFSGSGSLAPRLE
ncbi:MAG: phospholipase D family protein [Lysobacteraceae bacterium]|nr:MAG: phospholipase D family protein [Xanthomonadaceae bacterium]